MTNVTIAETGNPLVDAVVKACGLEGAEVANLTIKMPARAVITVEATIYLDVDEVAKAIGEMQFKAVDGD